MADIILVTGGAYQGKLDYVKENYKICINDIAQPDENGYIKDEDLNKTCINNFHLIIKDASKKGKNIVEVCDRILKIHENSQVIIIMDDVGCGIVPIEKKERLYRENVGRAGCYIARKANKVLRVSCGYGMSIKDS